MSSIGVSPVPDPNIQPATSTVDALQSARQSARAPLIMSLAFALSDLFTLTFAIWIGSHIWRLENPTIPRLHPALALISGCCVAEFAFSGHYPGIGLTAVEHMRRVCRGVTLVYVLMTAAMFVAKDPWESSRGALLVGWLISIVLAPVGRWLTSQVLLSRSLWGVPVVIIGAGSTGAAVIRNLKENRILGYRPVACIDDDFRNIVQCEGVPVVAGLPDAGAVAERCHTQYAIFAIPSMPRERFAWNLRRWSRIFPKILIVPNLTGVSTLWTEPRDLGGILGLEMRQNLLNRWNQRIKRAVDVVVSFLGLIAVAPLLGVCALWIRKASPGRAFYTQEREGRDGQPIHVLKLRTMYPNAEQMLEKYLASDPAAREEWDRFCKLKHDPRVLPVVGHFLRRTSLDELPQLWNIFRGDMSLVGPRPFPAYHNERFDPEFRRVRIQVTPGLTGLWQVSARSNGDLKVQESLDNYYIRNWSLWLDIYIIIRTVRAVFTQEGSY